jgi:hypothetical protein
VEESEGPEESVNQEATVEEPAEASLDELMAKKADEPAAEEEAEELLEPGREERVEALSVKVVPQQPHEFTCKNCYLVKHRSQLADKKRMLCKDCA